MANSKKIVRLLFAASLAAVSALAVDSVDDLTGPWILLVDNYPVAAKSNVVRTYHPFQKYAGNPVLFPQHPWEQINYLYGTVLPNESGTGYRMWYQSIRTNDPCSAQSIQLYATSTNGIHWQKPALYQVDWCGSTSNNLYYRGFMTSVMHTPDDPDPAKQYKFMNLDNGGWSAGWSSNGINVISATNNPVFTAGGDSGQICWDPHTQQYLCYVKNSWYDANGLRRRAVSLAATTNFTNWPGSAPLILTPDIVDDRWSSNAIQRTHFYGLSAFPYESGYIGFLWIHRGTNLLGDLPGYQVGPIFVELVSSHDGVNWTRQEGDRPPILPLGGAGTWDAGMVFTARAPVVEGDTVKIWYGGFKNVHDTALNQQNGGIGLATMRKDGFASLDAAATTGTVLTKNILNASGPLRVNYQATGGSLKAEVLDTNNNVLPGYSQADCIPITGNSLTQAVTWATQAQLPVAPSPLRLRFILQNASIYSFMAGESAKIAALPEITQQPSSRVATPGNAASFTVGATGSSPLSYQWRKNNLNLNNGGHYVGSSTPTLNISNAETNDAAIYQCVITNLYGSITSAPVTLTVLMNPPVTLTAIPLAPGHSANEARALTPDGRYVVGCHSTFSTSGTNGFLYDVNGKIIRNGIISSGGAAAGGLSGVGYRIYNGQTQLVLGGWSAGWHANFMTTDGGATWSATRRDVNLGSSPGGPAANSLAGSATDIFHSTFRHHAVNAGNPVYVGRASGAWAMTPAWDNKGIPSGIQCSMNGVAATGRTVGYRTVSSVRNNYALQWNGTGTVDAWFFNGLNGTTTGEAFSLSADGLSVFGNSPVNGGRTGNWGYKALLAANAGSAVLNISELPNFPDTTSVGGTAAVPYGCTADGKFVVGMSYRGTERAVLWDTSDPNPGRWTVIDLTHLAAANGVSGIFTRLTRAYSVGQNSVGQLVIAGTGTDGANTRGFVMTIAPPLAPLAHPPTVRISSPTPGGFTFTFLSLDNAAITYHLERATNLNAPVFWATITTAPGNGLEINLSDPAPSASQRFYRVRVQ